MELLISIQFEHINGESRRIGGKKIKRDEKGELVERQPSVQILPMSMRKSRIRKRNRHHSRNGKMSSDKFSGEITLLVTDESKSKQMMHAALGVESMEGEAQASNPALPVKDQRQSGLSRLGIVEANTLVARNSECWN